MSLHGDQIGPASTTRYEAALHDGRTCGQAAAEYVIGFDLCHRHYRKLAFEVVDQENRKREQRELEWRRADEQLSALQRVKPSFRKEA